MICSKPFVQLSTIRHGMPSLFPMDRPRHPNLIIFPIAFFPLTNPMKWKSCLTLFPMYLINSFLKQGKSPYFQQQKYIFFKRYVSVNHLRAKKRTILCFNAQWNTGSKINTANRLSLFHPRIAWNYRIYHFLQGTLPLDGKNRLKIPFYPRKNLFPMPVMS